MSCDVHVQLCSHIKTNGIPCGSPALRERRFCHFHDKWKSTRMALTSALGGERASFTLPILEDAESIQVALMQIMQLLMIGELEPRKAGVLLYALQTASLNLRQMRTQTQDSEPLPAASALTATRVPNSGIAPAADLPASVISGADNGSNNGANNDEDGDGARPESIPETILRKAPAREQRLPRQAHRMPNRAALALIEALFAKTS